MRVWLATVALAAALAVVLLWTTAATCLIEQGSSAESCAYAPAVGFPAAVLFSLLLVAAIVLAVRTMLRSARPSG